METLLLSGKLPSLDLQRIGLDCLPDLFFELIGRNIIRKLERFKLNADFAVLSPVQKTSSHPDTQPLGWPAFQGMVDGVVIPVYALGGVGETDIEIAQSHGGQVVAGIGAFWD